MAKGFPSKTVQRWGAAVVLALVTSVATVSLSHPLANSAPPPEPDTKAAARTDCFGDSLPEGALLRVGTVRYRAGSPNDAALSPDGKTLATASYGEITLREVSTGRPLHRLRNADVPTGFSAARRFLCFSPDGRRLVSLGEGKPSGVPKYGPTVHVWDVYSGEEVRRFDLPSDTEQKHDTSADYIWFTPGAKEIGVMLDTGVARFIDPTTGKETRRWGTGQLLRRETPNVVASVDGDLLAVIDPEREKSLALFDVSAGRKRRRVAADTKLQNVVFSPDSAVLAALDAKAVIHLFEGVTGKECKSFAAPVSEEEKKFSGFMSLAYAPDGKVLYATSPEGPIFRWRMPEAVALAAMREETAHDPSIEMSRTCAVYPSPDGRSVVSVGWSSGLIRRWDISTGRDSLLPEGFSGVVCARLSPDGRRIAVGDYGGKLALFDAATGHQSRILRPRGPVVISLSWSPDGKTLAVQQRNDAVGLWDVCAGREVRVLRLPRTGFFFRIVAPAFSPDGRYLLTSNEGLRISACSILPMLPLCHRFQPAESGSSGRSARKS